MPEYLEIWDSAGRRLVVLDSDRVSLGKAGGNDVAVTSDPTLSRLHAALERFPAGWSARDLSSRNGTFVNGQRVLGSCPLRDGDEIRVGQTRLVFHTDDRAGDRQETQAAEPAPELTRRERDVLLSLCRPVLAGDVFTEPASIRQIARELVVSDAAVKQHMLHLFDKFGVWEGERRRARLANDAIRRGAVSLADLRGQARSEDG